MGYTLQANGGQKAHIKRKVKKAITVMGQVWEIKKRRFEEDKVKKI